MAEIDRFFEDNPYRDLVDGIMDTPGKRTGFDDFLEANDIDGLLSIDDIDDFLSSSGTRSTQRVPETPVVPRPLTLGQHLRRVPDPTDATSRTLATIGAARRLVEPQTVEDSPEGFVQNFAESMSRGNVGGKLRRMYMDISLQLGKNPDDPGLKQAYAAIRDIQDIHSAALTKSPVGSEGAVRNAYITAAQSLPAMYKQLLFEAGAIAAALIEPTPFGEAAYVGTRLARAAHGVRKVIGGAGRLASTGVKVSPKAPFLKRAAAAIPSDIIRGAVSIHNFGPEFFAEAHGRLKAGGAPDDVAVAYGNGARFGGALIETLIGPARFLGLQSGGVVSSAITRRITKILGDKPIKAALGRFTFARVIGYLAEWSEEGGQQGLTAFLTVLGARAAEDPEVFASIMESMNEQLHSIENQHIAGFRELADEWDAMWRYAKLGMKESAGPVAALMSFGIPLSFVSEYSTAAGGVRVREGLAERGLGPQVGRLHEEAGPDERKFQRLAKQAIGRVDTGERKTQEQAEREQGRREIEIEEEAYEENDKITAEAKTEEELELVRSGGPILNDAAERGSSKEAKAARTEWKKQMKEAFGDRAGDLVSSIQKIADRRQSRLDALDVEQVEGRKATKKAADLQEKKDLLARLEKVAESHGIDTKKKGVEFGTLRDPQTKKKYYSDDVKALKRQITAAETAKVSAVPEEQSAIEAARKAMSEDDAKTFDDLSASLKKLDKEHQRLVETRDKSQILAEGGVTITERADNEREQRDVRKEITALAMKYANPDQALQIRVAEFAERMADKEEFTSEEDVAFVEENRDAINDKVKEIRLKEQERLRAAPPKAEDDTDIRNIPLHVAPSRNKLGEIDETVEEQDDREALEEKLLTRSKVRLGFLDKGIEALEPQIAALDTGTNERRDLQQQQDVLKEESEAISRNISRSLGVKYDPSGTPLDVPEGSRQETEQWVSADKELPDSEASMLASMGREPGEGGKAHVSVSTLEQTQSARRVVNRGDARRVGELNEYLNSDEAKQDAAIERYLIDNPEVAEGDPKGRVKIPLGRNVPPTVSPETTGRQRQRYRDMAIVKREGETVSKKRDAALRVAKRIKQGDLIKWAGQLWIVEAKTGSDITLQRADRRGRFTPDTAHVVAIEDFAEEVLRGYDSNIFEATDVIYQAKIKDERARAASVVDPPGTAPTSAKITSADEPVFIEETLQDILDRVKRLKETRPTFRERWASAWDRVFQHPKFRKLMAPVRRLMNDQDIVRSMMVQLADTLDALEDPTWNPNSLRAEELRKSASNLEAQIEARLAEAERLRLPESAPHIVTLTQEDLGRVMLFADAVNKATDALNIRRTKLESAGGSLSKAEKLRAVEDLKTVKKHRQAAKAEYAKRTESKAKATLSRISKQIKSIDRQIEAWKHMARISPAKSRKEGKSEWMEEGIERGIFEPVIAHAQRQLSFIKARIESVTGKRLSGPKGDVKLKLHKDAEKLLKDDEKLAEGLVAEIVKLKKSDGVKPVAIPFTKKSSIAALEADKKSLLIYQKSMRGLGPRVGHERVFLERALSGLKKEDSILADKISEARVVSSKGTELTLMEVVERAFADNQSFLEDLVIQRLIDRGRRRKDKETGEVTMTRERALEGGFVSVAEIEEEIARVIKPEKRGPYDTPRKRDAIRFELEESGVVTEASDLGAESAEERSRRRTNLRRGVYRGIGAVQSARFASLDMSSEKTRKLEAEAEEAKRKQEADEGTTTIAEPETPSAPIPETGNKSVDTKLRRLRAVIDKKQAEYDAIPPLDRLFDEKAQVLTDEIDALTSESDIIVSVHDALSGTEPTETGYIPPPPRSPAQRSLVSIPGRPTAAPDDIDSEESVARLREEAEIREKLDRLSSKTPIERITNAIIRAKAELARARAIWKNRPSRQKSVERARENLRGEDRGRIDARIADLDRQVEGARSKVRTAREAQPAIAFIHTVITALRGAKSPSQTIELDVTESDKAAARLRQQELDADTARGIGAETRLAMEATFGADLAAEIESQIVGLETTEKGKEMVAGKASDQVRSIVDGIISALKGRVDVPAELGRLLGEWADTHGRTAGLRVAEEIRPQRRKFIAARGRQRTRVISKLRRLENARKEKGLPEKKEGNRALLKVLEQTDERGLLGAEQLGKASDILRRYDDFVVADANLGEPYAKFKEEIAEHQKVLHDIEEASQEEPVFVTGVSEREAKKKQKSEEEKAARRRREFERGRPLSEFPFSLTPDIVARLEEDGDTGTARALLHSQNVDMLTKESRQQASRTQLQQAGREAVGAEVGDVQLSSMDSVNNNFLHNLHNAILAERNAKDEAEKEVDSARAEIADLKEQIATRQVGTPFRIAKRQTALRVQLAKAEKALALAEKATGWSEVSDFGKQVIDDLGGTTPGVSYSPAAQEAIKKVEETIRYQTTPLGPRATISDVVRDIKRHFGIRIKLTGENDDVTHKVGTRTMRFVVSRDAATSITFTPGEFVMHINPDTMTMTSVSHETTHIGVAGLSDANLRAVAKYLGIDVTQGRVALEENVTQRQDELSVASKIKSPRIRAIVNEMKRWVEQIKSWFDREVDSRELRRAQRVQRRIESGAATRDVLRGEAEIQTGGVRLQGERTLPALLGGRVLADPVMAGRVAEIINKAGWTLVEKHPFAWTFEAANGDRYTFGLTSSLEEEDRLDVNVSRDGHVWQWSHFEDVNKLLLYLNSQGAIELVGVPKSATLEDKMVTRKDEDGFGVQHQVITGWSDERGVLHPIPEGGFQVAKTIDIDSAQVRSLNAPDNIRFQTGGTPSVKEARRVQSAKEARRVQKVRIKAKEMAARGDDPRQAMAVESAIRKKIGSKTADAFHSAYDAAFKKRVADRAKKTEFKKESEIPETAKKKKKKSKFEPSDKFMAETAEFVDRRVASISTPKTVKSKRDSNRFTVKERRRAAGRVARGASLATQLPTHVAKNISAEYGEEELTDRTKVDAEARKVYFDTMDDLIAATGLTYTEKKAKHKLDFGKQGTEVVTGEELLSYAMYLMSSDPKSDDTTSGRLFELQKIGGFRAKGSRHADFLIESQQHLADMLARIKALNPNIIAEARRINPVMNELSDKTYAVFKEMYPESNWKRRDFYLHVVRDHYAETKKDRTKIEEKRQFVKSTWEKEHAGVLPMIYGTNSENFSELKQMTGTGNSPILVLGAYDLIEKTVRDLSKFIAMAPYIRKQKSMLKDKRFIDKLSKKFGDPGMVGKYIENMERELNSMAGVVPNLDQFTGFIDAILRATLGAAAVSFVADLWVAFKQAGSYPNLATYFGGDIWREASLMVMDRDELNDIRSRAVGLSYRGREKAGGFFNIFDDMRASSGYLIIPPKTLKEVARHPLDAMSVLRDKGMFLTKAVDRKVVNRAIPMAKIKIGRTWTGAKGDAYKDAIALEAAKAAMETQVQTTATNRSNVQRNTSVYFKAFTFMRGARSVSGSAIMASIERVATAFEVLSDAREAQDNDAIREANKQLKEASGDVWTQFLYHGLLQQSIIEGIQRGKWVAIPMLLAGLGFGDEDDDEDGDEGFGMRSIVDFGQGVLKGTTTLPLGGVPSVIANIATTFGDNPRQKVAARSRITSEFAPAMGFPYEIMDLGVANSKWRRYAAEIESGVDRNGKPLTNAGRRQRNAWMEKAQINQIESLVTIVGSWVAGIPFSRTLAQPAFQAWRNKADNN